MMGYSLAWPKATDFDSVIARSNRATSAKHGVVMSRSYRKTPIYPHSCSTSEADDKRRWHKIMRHTEKQKLAAIPLYEFYSRPDIAIYWEQFDYCCPFCLMDWYEGPGGYGHITVLPKDVSNLWDMAKDGKSYMTKDRLFRCIDYPFSYLNVDPMRRYYRLVSK